MSQRLIRSDHSDHDHETMGRERHVAAMLPLYLCIVQVRLALCDIHIVHNHTNLLVSKTKNEHEKLKLKQTVSVKGCCLCEFVYMSFCLFGPVCDVCSIKSHQNHSANCRMSNNALGDRIKFKKMLKHN